MGLLSIPSQVMNVLIDLVEHDITFFLLRTTGGFEYMKLYLKKQTNKTSILMNMIID